LEAAGMMVVETPFPLWKAAGLIADFPTHRFSPQGGEARDFEPPGFFTAVQEQLGLKLQSSRDSVEAVVVDHIEQTPTRN
jgi:uncharacterized protein (TIGR03435 family)